MRKVVFSLLVFLAVSCQGGPRRGGSDGLLTISLEEHWVDADTLRVSDYFSSVEYIPLETSDSCLVGAAPRVFLCRDTLVVVADQTRQGLAFSRSGRFLHPIGGEGHGPREYRSARSMIMNIFDATLLFPDYSSGKYKRYTLRSELLAPLKIAPDSGKYPDQLGWIDRESLVGYFNSVSLWGGAQRIVIYNNEMQVKRVITRTATLDTFIYKPKLVNNTLHVDNQTLSVDVIDPASALHSYGLIGYGGVVRFENRVNGAIKSLFNSGDAVFSYYKGDLYLREDFNDTIFRVNSDGLHPYVVFDFGKYHWPIESRYDEKKYGSSRTFISWYTENQRHIFFEYFVGVADRTAFRGSYNKSSQILRIGKAIDGFYDDINGFMPLQILAKTADGNFVGVLEPLKIRKWFEENPDKAAALPEHLKAFRNIPEEANPVVVVMRP